jgi:hypothetical protein
MHIFVLISHFIVFALNCFHADFINMPKEKTTVTQRRTRWINDLRLDVCVKLDGSKFVCQVSANLASRLIGYLNIIGIMCRIYELGMWEKLQLFSTEWAWAAQQDTAPRKGLTSLHRCSCQTAVDPWSNWSLRLIHCRPVWSLRCRRYPIWQIEECHPLQFSGEVYETQDPLSTNTDELPAKGLFQREW